FGLVSAMVELAKDHEVVLLASSAFPESLDPLRERLTQHSGGRFDFRVFHLLTPVAAAVARNHWRRRAGAALRAGVLADIAPDAIVQLNLVSGYDDDAIVSSAGYACPSIALVPGQLPARAIGTPEYLAWL